MSYEDPWGKSAQADGCLAVAIRIPVRIIAVIVVLPLRLLWDALCALDRGIVTVLRAIGRYVFAPPLRWLRIALAALWRYVLAPAGRVLLVVPARWLWRTVLRPVLEAVAYAVAFVVRCVLVWPLLKLGQYVLAPVGRALAWLLRVLVVVPLVFVWERVLVPVGGEIAAALGHAWRVTGYVSKAIGRVLARLFRVLVAVPVAWVWRRTGAPVVRGLRAAGRWARRAVWQPVREAVADARRTVRTALFGAPPPMRRPPPDGNAPAGPAERPPYGG